MPQERHRPPGVSVESGVGDVEAGGLDAAPVVPLHRCGADHTDRVGDQLGARGGELAQVAPDRIHQRADRGGFGAATGAPELRADEGRLVRVLLDDVALDGRHVRTTQGVQELLPSLATAVTEHQDDLGDRRQEVGERIAHQVIRASLDTVDDDEPRLVEQRRAGDHPERPSRILTCVQPRDLDVRVLLPCELDHAIDGPLGQQLLRARDQDDGRRRRVLPREGRCARGRAAAGRASVCGRHGPSLPRTTDGRGRGRDGTVSPEPWLAAAPPHEISGPVERETRVDESPAYGGPAYEGPGHPACRTSSPSATDSPMSWHESVRSTAAPACS
ncbi:hypothetical protein GALL_396500 [mine drainage metagenome]|uniref:Uncharacterized protein n=1 Tax=mine drainage metagenome TaxID=410659 RepID=A0A1J5QRS9_9ZZZZ